MYRGLGFALVWGNCLMTCQSDYRALFGFPSRRKWIMRPAHSAMSVVLIRQPATLFHFNTVSYNQPPQFVISYQQWWNKIRRQKSLYGPGLTSFETEMFLVSLFPFKQFISKLRDTLNIYLFPTVCISFLATWRSFRLESPKSRRKRHNRLSERYPSLIWF